MKSKKIINDTYNKIKLLMYRLKFKTAIKIKGAVNYEK